MFQNAHFFHNIPQCWMVSTFICFTNCIRKHWTIRYIKYSELISQPLGILSRKPTGRNEHGASILDPKHLRERTYIPRYLCLSVPMFPGNNVPRTYVPRYLCSSVPIFPCTYVPRYLCSPVGLPNVPRSPVPSMFPGSYCPLFSHVDIIINRSISVSIVFLIVC